MSKAIKQYPSQHLHATMAKMMAFLFPNAISGWSI
jgi:hypothetical protein